MVTPPPNYDTSKLQSSKKNSIRKYSLFVNLKLEDCTFILKNGGSFGIQTVIN